MSNPGDDLLNSAKVEFERSAELSSEDFAELVGQVFAFTSFETGDAAGGFRLESVKSLNFGHSGFRKREPFSLLFFLDEGSPGTQTSQLYRVCHRELDPLIVFANPVKIPGPDPRNPRIGLEVIFD